MKNNWISFIFGTLALAAFALPGVAHAQDIGPVEAMRRAQECMVKTSMIEDVKKRAEAEFACFRPMFSRVSADDCHSLTHLKEGPEGYGSLDIVFSQASCHERVVKQSESPEACFASANHILTSSWGNSDRVEGQQKCFEKFYKTLDSEACFSLASRIESNTNDKAEDQQLKADLKCANEIPKDRYNSGVFHNIKRDIRVVRSQVKYLQNAAEIVELYHEIHGPQTQSGAAR